MIQSPDQRVMATQALWTYTGVGEEAGEEDFFRGLEQIVADELRRRYQEGGSVWVGREMRLRVGEYEIQAQVANLEPLLASRAGANTVMLARYRQRGKDEGQDTSAFLAEVIRYPNSMQGAALRSLVGLDSIRDDLYRKLALLLVPSYLRDWLTQTYGAKPPQGLWQALRDRYPLVLLEGEVGAGKTALARSIGDLIATKLNTELALYVVNAQVRGGGHVGELTLNISRAFNEAEKGQRREQIPVLILIDEADALAQSRGGRQTHHEDDAGVNTLIQRIDRLRGRPMAVLFATNLAQSLDAAIVRRSLASYHFDRPNPAQRAQVFRFLLAGIGISEQDIATFVQLTEARPLPGYGRRGHRYTYSDLSQRIIPRAVEDAVFTGEPLTAQEVMAACQTIAPTPELRLPASESDPE